MNIIFNFYLIWWFSNKPQNDKTKFKEKSTIFIFTKTQKIIVEKYHNAKCSKRILKLEAFST